MAISELSNTQHQAIKINPNAGVEYAKTQHLVNL
ncbi:MAG: SapC family protein, partial [Pseudoalteromonas sp.]|nr:SapC family protein [Pseudoalteromonas sp.]